MFKRICTLENIEVYNVGESFIKSANLATEWKQIVRDSFTRPTIELESGFDPENFIYFKARAISAGEKWGSNGNGDYFPAEEIKKSINTFIGKGFFLEHDSDNPDKAVGIIVSAKYLDEPAYAECIVAINKKDQPEVCRRVVAGELNAVSMGCICSEATCYICGNVAHNENELCMHMRPHMDKSGSMPNPSYCKGKEITSGTAGDPFGSKKLAYEINKKLVFNELSGVKKPADRDANIYSNTIIASTREDKIMGDSLLDKLSYNDYKMLKKALSEDDDEFITKIAKKIKAEIGETVKEAEKSEKKPEDAKVEPEKKAPEAAKAQINKVKEEIKDLKEEIKEVKEEVQEVKQEVKEEAKEEKKEVKEEMAETKEEKKEEKEEAKEEGSEDLDKEMEELLGEGAEGEEAEGEDNPELAEGGLDDTMKELGEDKELPALPPAEGAGAEGSPELGLAASQNTNKEGTNMNLVYIPGTTFDTSYFVASNDAGDKKVVKASLIVPQEVQDKIVKEAADVPKVEEIVSKIAKTCDNSYDNFVKLASDTAGFQKKAYDFFAFKMENAPKMEKGGEPIVAIEEKEIEKGEKATKSAPKVISQYFNRLPGTTAADPDIALNLKSKLDETTKTVDELKKIIAEKDAKLTKLATDLEVVSKKVKAEDVSKVMESVPANDEDKARLSEQLAKLDEAQLAVVNEIVKTATAASARPVVASAKDNVPQITKDETGPESPLESLITSWAEITDTKNMSNNL